MMMGAWGSGIFENDTACDFAADVAEGGGVSLVDQALDRVLARGGNYLEAREAEECLAAAEIIARLKGSPGDETPYTALVDAWIKGSPASVSAEIVEKAKRAIARVLAEPSELVELWAESDDFDSFRRSVEALSGRL
jgi:Domain of unknown function (DUF4259)